MKKWVGLLWLPLIASIFYGTELVAGPIPKSVSASDAPMSDVPPEKYTFEMNEFLRGAQYATGRIQPPSPSRAVPSKEFISEDVYKKANTLENLFGITFSPITNQGSCGSCVYFATTATFIDTLRIRGIEVPNLSEQWLMSCAAPDSQCSGSWFESVAGGLSRKGGEAAESDYPYQARTMSCKSGEFKLYGKIVGFKIIDNSPKSIIGALHKGYAVATTIGAGGNMSSYRSGIMNGCQNIGTNHEMVIEGYDCETAVDSAGNCQFDSQGKLPNGVGWWLVRNSWAESYGDKGWLRIKMTDTRGNLCNNIAEEVGILDIGQDPKPPVPPVPPTPPTPTPGGIPLFVWIILGVAAVLFGIAFIVKKKSN